jgi:rhodanese-related sulfurtransferase
VASIETMTAEQVADVLRVGRKPVLDVRFAYEHTAQSLIGALARPVDRLQEWAPALPPTPALVVCQSGERAAMAASFLQRAVTTCAASSRAAPMRCKLLSPPHQPPDNGNTNLAHGS